MGTLTTAQPSAGARSPASIDAFAYLRALVLRRASIALDDDKQYLVEARLSGLARERGDDSVWDLLLHLRLQPEGAIHTEVVEAMTTNETSFFRDPNLFKGIGESIIPDLIARRAQERRLSIWSAACSTGQEPYSLAIMLREHPQFSPSWNLRILATDLSTQVLGRAREGRFSKLEVNRGLAANRLLRWFTQEGTEWMISEDLKRMVDYRQLNLVGPWPTVSQVDLVMLRNVLIYFPVDIKKQVLTQVRSVLRPDGYLVLGNAETTLNLDNGFQRVDIGGATAFQVVQP